MRIKSLLAALAALATIGFANPQSAQAFGLDREHRPDGWGKDRVINHHVYYPRYVHHYHVDPYAYRYSPRGYYPYYNSGYWTKASIVRKRSHLHYYHWNSQGPKFKYQSSWGKPAKWGTHEHYGNRYFHRWHY